VRPRGRLRARASAHGNGTNLQKELEEIKKRVDAFGRKLGRPAPAVS
jgi:hypothetical protein